MANNAHSPSFVVLNTVWFLLGFFILLGNTITTIFMWKTKKARQRANPGVFPHAMWNLLEMDTSFAGLGLILTIYSLTRLSVDSEVTKGVCNFFGFSITFLFHFGAMGILNNLVDKCYCLWKPFRYHGFARSRSKSPLLAFLCCLLYGFINAFFPLINLGDYSPKARYSTCLSTWDSRTSTRFIGFLNVTIAIVIFGFILGIFRLRFKLLQNRREMKVALTRPKETLIFALSVSCLFLICWIPYLITMVVLIYSEDTSFSDKGKASLFGITLIPLVFNPFLSYGLHGYFREECNKGLDSLKQCFPVKNRGTKTLSNTAVDIERTQTQQTQL